MCYNQFVKKLCRFNQMLDIIRNQPGISTESLAKTLNVSSKCIQLNLNELKDRYNAPIKSHKRMGHFLTLPEFELSELKSKHLEFDEEEMIALTLAENLLKNSGDMAIYGPALESALRKMQVYLDNPGRHTIQRIKNSISHEFQSKSIEGKAPIKDYFQKLIQAVLTFKKVEIQYFSLHVMSEKLPSLSTRTIHPYHLRFANGTWYVIGYCEKREQILTFTLHRIRRLLLTEDDFSISSKFKIKTYLPKNNKIHSDREKSLDVTVMVSEKTAHWILEKQWFPSQRVLFGKAMAEPQTDGDIISGNPVKIQFASNSLNETLLWIQQFGKNVKVLRPKELIEHINADVKDQVAYYSKILKNIEANTKNFEELNQRYKDNQTLFLNDFEAVGRGVISDLKTRGINLEEESVLSLLFEYTAKNNPLKKYNPNANCRFHTFLFNDLYFFLYNQYKHLQNEIFFENESDLDLFANYPE